MSKKKTFGSSKEEKRKKQKEELTFSFSPHLQMLIEDRNILLKQLECAKKWKYAGELKKFFLKMIFIGKIYEKNWIIEDLIISDLEKIEEELLDFFELKPFHELIK